MSTVRSSKDPQARLSGDACVSSADGVLHPDRIDDAVRQWGSVNSGLNCELKTLSLRIRTLAKMLEKAMRQDMLAANGVELWEFETLMALRLTDDGTSGAGQLCRQMAVTSGAMTNRLARLEAQDWLVREIDPRDRRQVVVRLTPAGKERAAYLAGLKNQTEERFYAEVPTETVENCSQELKKLLAIVSPRLVHHEEDPEQAS